MCFTEKISFLLRNGPVEILFHLPCQFLFLKELKEEDLDSGPCIQDSSSPIKEETTFLMADALLKHFKAGVSVPCSGRA